jgi:peptidoglycan/xylan/chitin deacetylase (PgdA/CDA1 family)
VSRALLLLYHDIRDGQGPLCLAPGLFSEHLDCLADANATVLTVSELARARDKKGRLDEPTVSITFDDGFASVVDEAVPRLVERGFPATLFCVAGHLGGTNDWPSQPRWVERRPLASARALTDAVAAGVEVGAHGYHHRSLAAVSADELREEVVGSHDELSTLLGAPVESFAYPYGVMPASPRRTLVDATYRAACTTRLSRMSDGDELLALPRVDAHYVRDPERLRRVVLGHGGAYLAMRRGGRAVRRLARRTLV